MPFALIFKLFGFIPRLVSFASPVLGLATSALTVVNPVAGIALGVVSGKSAIPVWLKKTLFWVAGILVVFGIVWLVLHEASVFVANQEAQIAHETQLAQRDKDEAVVAEQTAAAQEAEHNDMIQRMDTFNAASQASSASWEKAVEDAQDIAPPAPIILAAPVPPTSSNLKVHHAAPSPQPNLATGFGALHARFNGMLRDASRP